MRGVDEFSGSLFSYADLDEHIRLGSRRMISSARILANGAITSAPGHFWTASLPPTTCWRIVDMMPTGIAKPLKTRGSRRASLHERTARFQSPMTRHAIENATRSRTASLASRTGDGSRPATTGARRYSCRHAPWLPCSCSGYEY